MSLSQEVLDGIREGLNLVVPEDNPPQDSHLVWVRQFAEKHTALGEHVLFLVTCVFNEDSFDESEQTDEVCFVHSIEEAVNIIDRLRHDIQSRRNTIQKYLTDRDEKERKQGHHVASHVTEFAELLLKLTTGAPYCSVRMLKNNAMNYSWFVTPVTDVPWCEL